MYTITGATKQNLQYWNMNGLITPFDCGQGIGTSRLYSYGNLVEITVIQYLWSLFPNNSGFVKYIMTRIRKDNPDAFENSWDDPRFGSNILIIVVDDDSKYVEAYLRPKNEAKSIIETKSNAGCTVIFKQYDLIRTGLTRRLKAWEEAGA